MRQSSKMSSKSSATPTRASAHNLRDDDKPGTSRQSDMPVVNREEKNKPGTSTQEVNPGSVKMEDTPGTSDTKDRVLSMVTRSSAKKTDLDIKPGTSKEDDISGTSTWHSTSSQGHKSETTRKSSDNQTHGRNKDTDEPEKKRFKTSSPVGVTTRSSSAKKKHKIHFVSERDCECDPHFEHEYFSISGKRIKTCKRDTLLQRYWDLLETIEYKDLDEVRPDIYIDIDFDHFSRLSVDMMCYIFDYLSIKEVLRLESMSRKIQRAVQLSLNLRQDIDFLENVTGRQAFENNLPTMTDYMLKCLISKLPRLRNIYHFHPQHLSCRQSRTNNKLTIQGVVDALTLSTTLKGIQISNVHLLEAILVGLSQVSILGRFQNRERHFPPDITTCINIPEESRITSLHLVGCCISNLPQMDLYLKHLYLRMVKFAHPHPFKDFSAYGLETFVMAHCIGPVSALKYIPLLTAIAEAPRLKRLELQRVPFLGGVIQHICEDNWQDGGFRRLTSITTGACKNALDADLGFLIIAAAASLERLCIQPSLTRDAFFSALAITDVTMNPGFDHLSLGWVDSFPEKDEWSNDELVAEGLSDVTEMQSRITDTGMSLVGQCFPPLKTLEIYNCPHLYNPMLWFSTGLPYYTHVRELTLRACHSLRLDKFCLYIHYLPNLEYLTLEEMFKEQPKGCSRVGLSAGTGLGVSNALVTSHQQPPAMVNPVVNQGQGQANHGNPGHGQAVHGNHDVANDNSEVEDEESGDEAANQNVRPRRRRTASQNASTYRRHSNRRGRRSLSQSDRQGYNLRHTPRSQSGPDEHSNQGQGQSSSHNFNRRKSPRFSNGKPNHGPSDKSFSENCDCNNNSKCDTLNSSSCNKCDNSNMPGTSGSGQGSSQCVISGKGKALMTKKGLVKRSKSSKGTEQHCQSSQVAPDDNSAATLEERKEEPVCTCVTPTQEVGCQATMEDIKNANNRQKETRKRRKRRKSKRKSREKDRDRVIIPRPYIPSASTSRDDGRQSSSTPECYIHRSRRRKPARTCDRCNSTSDPVMEEDYPQVLTITHRRLEYLCLNFVGVTEINMNCYLMKTLSISRCRVLKKVNLKQGQFLKHVHVSQCRKFDENHLMDSIYRLPSCGSKFVSLRPLHQFDESLFYHNMVLSEFFQDYNYGTVMVFDYSNKPSETNYNKLRVKSWTDMLERLSVKTMEDYDWQRFLDMEHPNKGLDVLDGHSTDGSRWMVMSDLPWIPLLNNCPNMEREYIKNPEWLKDGVYCMEAKGHFSFWDAYSDLQEVILLTGKESTGLYDYNVITYVNMCDVSGVPTQDSTAVM